MGAYIARRLLGLIPLLLLISFAVFALVLAVPGDPARTIAGGLDASDTRVDEIRDELGLDDPLLEQYGRWLGGVLSGDLGSSMFNGRTVASELAARIANERFLAGICTISARGRNRSQDDGRGGPVAEVPGAHPSPLRCGS